MAKYESALVGDFDALLRKLHNGIMSGSVSASLEGGSDIQSGGVRCAVRVYERYSYAGGNRLSMNVTLLGNADQLFVSVITSGGSKAMFFKINTWGEETFLEHAVRIVEDYKRM